VPEAVRRPVGHELPAEYAAFSRDENPIHLEVAAAVAAGLPGVVLHGMCTAAWCVDAIGEAAGSPPLEFECRFAAPLCPGQQALFTPTPRGDARWGCAAIREDGEVLLKHTDASTEPTAIQTSAGLPASESAPPADLSVSLEAQALARYRDLLGFRAEWTAGLLLPLVRLGPSVLALARSRGLEPNGAIQTGLSFRFGRAPTAPLTLQVGLRAVEDRTRGRLHLLTVEAEFTSYGAHLGRSRWTLVRPLDPVSR
jgi:hypothetical protein